MTWAWKYIAVNVATGDCRARSTATRPAMNERVRSQLHARPRAESCQTPRRYQTAAASNAAATSTAKGPNCHWVKAAWALNGTRVMPAMCGMAPGYRPVA